MIALAVALAVTCYNYGVVTQCSDGTVIYKYGNQIQIDPASQQPSRQSGPKYPTTPTIESIPTFDSDLRVLEPFK